MIVFRASTRCAAAVSDDAVTVGSVGIPVFFTFSAEWESVQKIVIFKAGDVAVDVALTGSSCTVPPECLADAGMWLTIGVYGANAAGTVVIPTVWAEAAPIQPGAEPSGVDPAEPTPSWVAQVQEMASEALAHMENMSAEATTLPAGSSATASWDPVTDTLSLGIPQGDGGGGTPYDDDPEPLGDADPGVSDAYSRGDHVHPMPSASDVGAYELPSGGIPDTDLAAGVQTSLGKADSAYQKPSGGIPDTDLSAGVQSSLGKADAALPKAGGTMSGAIAMGGNKITGLAQAENDGDAVPFSQMSSAISQSAAYYRGSFATRAALLAVAWQTSDPQAANYVTNNDYAIVQDDEAQSDECWRYLYVLGTGWTAQYRINETPLTQAQLDALNSGATAAAIGQISTNTAAIAGKITAPANPSNGQFLVYDSTADAWTAQTVPSANGVSF